MPTFSFGLGYWGAPAYYESYYTTPSVVYTTPTVIETTPAYGDTTYYAETPTYVDSGTTYVETTPATESYSSTQVDRQYVDTAQPAPAIVDQVPQPTTTAAPVTAPATTQTQQAPPKEPDPRVLEAVGKGNEHFGAGRYDEARRSYAEAMLVDGTDGVAKLLFGLARFAEADYVSAATTVREALDATPDLIWYPFNVKALYRNESRFQEHLDALARHAQAEPGNNNAQFLLGYMWYASGDAASAKTIFTSLATNNPSDELYMALRDASTQALEAISRPSTQSAAPAATSDTAKVPVVPTP